VWKSRLDGRTLHFHLAGINNQNFIMRDEETGSWWQQVTGCAILGPLSGRCLEQITWDEVTFDLFRREYPDARVLLPVLDLKENYAGADWENEIAELPTVTPVDPRDVLKPRDLVVGITSDGSAKAYPWVNLRPAFPIVDTVGGTPLLILLNTDGRSMRCFDRRLEGRTLQRFSGTQTCPPVVHDDDTGSTWDFGGLATAGPLAGARLARLICLKDYWFDWKTYNPRTAVFAADGAGQSPKGD